MLKITGIQFDICWENKGKNIAMIESMLNSISPDQDVLILPEMFTTGFSMNPIPFSEKMGGETMQWMKEISRDLDMAICGSLMVSDQNIYRNRFIWVEPNGKVLYYDKGHPFCLNDEGTFFRKGRERTIIEYKGWRLFPSICYDLRFPVWNRNDLNYDLLINVANWPAVRSFSWKQFLSARALENQSYVVGINRIGKDDFGTLFTGDSRIVSFDGKSLAEAKAGESQLIEGILSKESLVDYRSKYPFLNDRDPFEFTGLLP